MSETNKKPEEKETIKEIPKKYLLIYSSGRTKTQSVLFPDTIEAYNARELTSLIELTELKLFQGDNQWTQIPHLTYTAPQASTLKKSKDDKPVKTEDHHYN